MISVENVKSAVTGINLNGTTHAESHQHQALKYAVAMTGAGAHDTTSHLEQQCYVAARFHLEMAETQVENSSFLNLQTVQTLILVARYEFLRTRAERAIITSGAVIDVPDVQGTDCHYWS